MTTAPDWTTCPDCGKRSYRAKRDAKTLRRRLGDGRLSVYRCLGSGYWHVGHKPHLLARGVISRDDVEQRRR
ncbi:hypothetical protein [Gordonia sp. NPDC003376]